MILSQWSPLYVICVILCTFMTGKYQAKKRIDIHVHVKVKLSEFACRGVVCGHAL